MKFYIVRHGQTLFNKKGRVQGWCDSPLTELGILQAKKRAEAIKDIDFLAAYSSTSERAIDTCQILMNGRDIPFKMSKNFKEMHFGEFEGDIGEEVFANLDDIVSFDAYFVEHGGESMSEVGKRFIDQLNEIAHEYKEGNILITAHGGCIMQALKKIDEIKSNHLINDKYGLNNCAMCIVEYTDHFEILEVCNEEL